MSKVTVTLHKSKETQGTWQYREENEGRHIRQVYVSKDDVKKLGSPESIKVTVEAA